MYKCNFCNKEINLDENISKNVVTINKKNFIKNNDQLNPLQCNDCLKKYENCKWTDNIANNIIKSVSVEFGNPFDNGRDYTKHTIYSDNMDFQKNNNKEKK
jgi:hypothetical protein